MDDVKAAQDRMEKRRNRLLQLGFEEVGTAQFRIRAVSGADGGTGARLDIPATVIQIIKDHPTEDARSLAGFTISDNPVIKAKRVTINAFARLSFRIKELPISVPFFAIVARDLFIEVPAIHDDSAAIDFLPQVVLNGIEGSPGQNGRSWRVDWWDDDGVFGGPGGPGYPGISGKTIHLPILYFMFERIHLSGGIPNTSRALGINLNGQNGGNGGRGGRGGDGGRAAKGTPSECNEYWPIGCECRAGPGIGGNGGPAGSGGRGGDAGNASDGGTIAFVGPETVGTIKNWDAISGFFEVMQEPGQPGQPGQPGLPGTPGVEGAGGTKCSCCNYREPGQPGAPASPTDLGPGHPGLIGIRGLQYFVDRNNNDLFS